MKKPNFMNKKAATKPSMMAPQMGGGVGQPKQIGHTKHAELDEEIESLMPVSM